MQELPGRSHGPGQVLRGASRQGLVRQEEMQGGSVRGDGLPPVPPEHVQGREPNGRTHGNARRTEEGAQEGRRYLQAPQGPEEAEDGGAEGSHEEDDRGGTRQEVQEGLRSGQGRVRSGQERTQGGHSIRRGPQGLPLRTRDPHVGQRPAPDRRGDRQAPGPRIRRGADPRHQAPRHPDPQGQGHGAEREPLGRRLRPRPHRGTHSPGVPHRGEGHVQDVRHGAHRVPQAPEGRR